MPKMDWRLSNKKIRLFDVREYYIRKMREAAPDLEILKEGVFDPAKYVILPFCVNTNTSETTNDDYNIYTNYQFNPETGDNVFTNEEELKEYGIFPYIKKYTKVNNDWSSDPEDPIGHPVFYNEKRFQKVLNKAKEKVGITWFCVLTLTPSEAKKVPNPEDAIVYFELKNFQTDFIRLVEETLGFDFNTPDQVYDWNLLSEFINKTRQMGLYCIYRYIDDQNIPQEIRDPQSINEFDPKYDIYLDIVGIENAETGVGFDADNSITSGTPPSILWLDNHSEYLNKVYSGEDVSVRSSDMIPKSAFGVFPTDTYFYLESGATIANLCKIAEKDRRILFKSSPLDGFYVIDGTNETYTVEPTAS